MPTDVIQRGAGYRTFAVLLALSLLAHGLLLLVFVIFSAMDESSSKTPAPVITVKLQTPQPPPAPKPEASEPTQEPPKPQPEAQEQQPEQAAHLPRHNAEETDLTGTDFDAPVEEKPLKGDEPGIAPSIDKQDDKTQLAEGKPRQKSDQGTAEKKTGTTPATVKPGASQSTVTDKTSATREKANPGKASPKKTEPTKQAFPEGVDAISDEELAGEKTGTLFSGIEARRIRMVNRHLERMQNQVRSYFRPPADIQARGEGIVAFELGPSGYLTFSRLARSSGNPVLDASALEAVRSVPRFDLPESGAVAARYYRNLTFRFRAKDQ